MGLFITEGAIPAADPARAIQALSSVQLLQVHLPVYLSNHGSLTEESS